MNKTCTKCKIDKDISNFSKKGSRKDGSIIYHASCKDCHRIYQKQHYKDNKDYYKKKSKEYDKKYKSNVYSFLKEYAKDGCTICGENDFECLDFDHISLGSKEFSISWMVNQRYSLKKIKKELKKCNILCANCHRRKTSKQFSWYC